MNKTNVYMFWYGSEYPKRVKDNIDVLNKIKSVNLVMGPTKEDHEYLMKEFKYYRRAVENKKFAFCKDLWSIWVQQKYGPGLAIDAGGKISNSRKFEVFIERIETIDNYFVKETEITISNCFFFISNKDVITGVLNFYKKNWWTRRIGPNILTRQIRKFIHKSSNWKKEFVDNSIFAQIMEINNGETGYIKGGYGSWHKKSQDYFKKSLASDGFEISGFVLINTEWFKKEKYPSLLWKIGVWFKKITFNY